MHVAQACKDPAHEIQSLGHLMVVKVAALPSFVGRLSQLKPTIEDLVDSIRATLETKLKETAVKQEVEKQNELIRSALRALLHIAKACGAVTIPEGTKDVSLTPSIVSKLDTFLQELKASPVFGPQWLEIAGDVCV